MEKFISTQYSRNSGLGNKLFPWSRAIILSNKLNYRLLKVRWVSPRGAGFIRGGIDYSNTFGKLFLCNNFIKYPKEISKVKSTFLRLCTRVIYLNDLNEWSENLLEGNESIICFRWNTSHNFEDIKPYRDLIFKSLLEITNYKSKSLIEAYSNKEFIVMNIRCGNDFVDDSNKVGYRKTPLYWFEQNILKIRTQSLIEILIISDGGPNQLKTLLHYENVKLLKSKKAIEDLLIMSKAKELYGSGDSTFSAWGSFLGNMPTYSWEETKFDKYFL